MAKHYHILFGVFNIIKAKLDLLISYNISSLTILKGLYIFDRSEDKMRDNYKFLRQNGLNEVMPWMLISDKNTMNKYINRRLEQRFINV